MSAATKLGELIKPRSLWRTLVVFAAVMGPGFITANVDNDAGGITTYTLAGAHFGYGLLWTMIPITIALVLVQEIVARMGVVTGKGLADLIRENYGVKVTFYLMMGLIATNLSNVIAEFAGVAASLGLFGVPKVFSVVSAALFVWWLVTQGDYKRVEKVFLFACLFYGTYLVTGWLVAPDWSEVMRATATPSFHWDREWLTMFLGLTGATIAPWMQFYQQASIVDKGLRASEYRLVRLDVVLGCLFTNLVTFFIIVVCAATLHKNGVVVVDAAQAAQSLKPLAGQYCEWLFAIGLLNASLFAASILPLSTAYSVCEGMGWQTGLDHNFETAPQFYGLYTLLIGIGALVVCWPGFPLIKVMFWSQVINGLILPAVLALCIDLSSREDLMGEFVNPPWFRWLAWSFVAAMTVLSMAMLWSML